ncbi:MAG: hypothetical protein Kow0027_08740 [Saprospiraceae bacterium]
MEQLTISKFKKLPAEVQRQVLDYIEFLLLKYQSRASEKRETPEMEKGEKPSPEEGMPDRLRIALKYKGDAPYPDVPISKYDWYEQ